MITTPFLVRWYGTFAAVASLMALQAILLPRWPSTAPLPAEAIGAALHQEGMSSTTSAPWDAKRSYELSTSAPVVVKFRDGLVLTLMDGTVRQRFNLQTAFIGREQPSLRLDKRRFIETPTPTAIGLAAGKPILQTCFVAGIKPQAGFGVSRDQLTALSDQRSSGWKSTLKRLIGLQPNRTYSCTLISLRSLHGESPSKEIWQKLIRTIEPTLNQHLSSPKYIFLPPS
jgi:hypothetical protein